MTIDWWTIGIQTVNVAVLVWLLQRFFWRPVAAMIAQRREATRRTLAEAEATRAEANAALAEIQRTRAGFAEEREAIQAAAREAAEHTKTALLAEAEAEAATLRSAAKAAIEQENRAAAEAWNSRAANLAVAISGRLAARLDGAAVHAVFLAWLVKAIEALPAAERQAASDSGVELEIVSASELDPAERQRTRERIEAAFGGALSLVFRSDPTLIAGLELHGPHLRVSNSWQADLARILACLTSGEAANDIVLA